VFHSTFREHLFECLFDRVRGRTDLNWVLHVVKPEFTISKLIEQAQLTISLDAFEPDSVLEISFTSTESLKHEP